MKMPLIILLFAEIFVVSVSLQASRPDSVSPELKLTTITGKHVRHLHEKLVIKTIFLNTSEKILCFPKPTSMEEVPAYGYLVTRELTQHKAERFLNHIDGGAPFPKEKLIDEINHAWIKLKPNETYIAEPAEIESDLDTPGEWRFQTTYIPPQGSFNVSKTNEYLRNAARTAGCEVPQHKVEASQFAVNVSTN